MQNRSFLKHKISLLLVVSLLAVACKERGAVAEAQLKPLQSANQNTKREQMRQHLISQIMLYKSRADKIANGKSSDAPFTIESGNAGQAGQSHKYHNILSFKQYVYYLRDSLRDTGPLDLRDTLHPFDAPTGLRATPFPAPSTKIH